MRHGADSVVLGSAMLKLAKLLIVLVIFTFLFCQRTL